MPAWAVAENLIYDWGHPWRCTGCPWRQFRSRLGVLIHARSFKNRPPHYQAVGDGPIRLITHADHRPWSVESP